MRVALKTDDGVVHWLAGQPGVSERDFSSVANFKNEGRINVQENQFIRARAAEYEDRLNLATTVTFDTTRKFPTVVAAFTFALDYDRTKPREGQLIFEIPVAGGAEVRRFMAGAVVLPPKILTIGVSVNLSYTVLGGRITT